MDPQPNYHELPDGTALPANCFNFGNGIIREYLIGGDGDPHGYNYYRVEE